MPNVSLPEAPALNLSNPSVGAAGEFANAGSHAYAAGLQFATALRDQALRGQQQKQQAANEAVLNKQKADADYAREQNEFNKIGRPLTQAEITGANSGVPQQQQLPPAEDAPPGTTSGGVAPTASAQPTFQNGPGGMTEAPTRQPTDPGHIQYDSRMQPWFVHTPEEMEAMKKPSFTPTGKMKEQMDAVGMSASPDGTVPFEQSGTLLERLGLAVPGPGKKNLDTGNYSDAAGNPATVVTDENTGVQTQVKPAAGLKQNPQASKADAQRQVQGWFGKNGLPMVVDPKSGKAVEMEMQEGAHPGLTAEQQEVAARIAIARQESAERIALTRQDRADQKAKDNQATANKAITDYQTKEQAQHDLRKQYGDALATAPTDSDGKPDPKGTALVIDPITKKEVELTPARRIAYQNELDKATKNAVNYHEAQRKLISANGGDSGAPLDLGQAPAKPTAPPAQQAPAAPAKAQTQSPAVASPGQQPAGTPTPAGKPGSKGKLTDMNIVGKYMNANGGDLKKAQAAAQADGWVF